MKHSDEFQRRRQAASAALEEHNLDALIVANGPNARYLTGFTGSNSAVLLTRGDAILFTDPRYQIQAAQEAACKVKVVRGPLLGPVMETAQRRKARRIGFETGRFTYAEFEALKHNLYLNASLEPAAGLIETLRMVKSPEEVQRIRTSVATASRAFDRAMKKVCAGVRETEIAAEIDYQMRKLGAERPSFDTIVASGERTALPHAQPAPLKISDNRLLLIDMGASQDGYASDMTRMAFLGTPGRKVKDLYRAVLDAQLAAISAVRAGISAQQVDRAARRVLRDRKLDKAFVHSTGHGLGLEIHEPPRIGKLDRTRLVAGMVITIEPGAYLEGFGGVRIEDTVVVTETGCEVLTPTSKELFVL